MDINRISKEEHMKDEMELLIAYIFIIGLILLIVLPIILMTIFTLIN